jgi:hypothetical protein
MRAETGRMKFGDDWPGVFIRGDNAGAYGLALQQVLDQEELHPILRLQVQGLQRLLAGSDERRSHLSETQVMRPFDQAKSEDAGATPVAQGATESA